MSIQSKFRAFWKMATTRVPLKGWKKSPGPEVTRSTQLSSVFRALIFGRGRRKRFYVAPTIRQFRKLFSSHPLASNSIFYGSLFVAAEWCHQTWNKGVHTPIDVKTSKNLDSIAHATRYDLGSIKRYALWGTFVIPPIYHTWYKWLDATYHLCEKSPLNRTILAKKMVLDQFLLTPVIVVLFFITMSAMEGKSDWLQECKQKFFKTFGADCCYWLPVQALNFVYVPSDLRVAFIAVATFVWMNVLCWFKSQPMDNESIEHSDKEDLKQVDFVKHVNSTLIDKSLDNK